MLPKYVIDFLIETFGDANASVIVNNWFRFSRLSLLNSSREDLMLEAKTVLALSTT